MKTSSAWRVAVTSEADRLNAQMNAALAAGGGQAAGGAPATAVREALARAQEAAASPSRRLRDWWSGSSIETAWQALHLASEQLMLMLPDDQLRAQVPQ